MPQLWRQRRAACLLLLACLAAAASAAPASDAHGRVLLAAHRRGHRAAPAKAAAPTTTEAPATMAAPATEATAAQAQPAAALPEQALEQALESQLPAADLAGLLALDALGSDSGSSVQAAAQAASDGEELLASTPGFNPAEAAGSATAATPASGDADVPEWAQAKAWAGGMRHQEEAQLASGEGEQQEAQGAAAQVRFASAMSHDAEAEHDGEEEEEEEEDGRSGHESTPSRGKERRHRKRGGGGHRSSSTSSSISSSSSGASSSSRDGSRRDAGAALATAAATFQDAMRSPFEGLADQPAEQPRRRGMGRLAAGLRGSGAALASGLSDALQGGNVPSLPKLMGRTASAMRISGSSNEQPKGLAGRGARARPFAAPGATAASPRKAHTAASSSIGSLAPEEQRLLASPLRPAQPELQAAQAPLAPLRGLDVSQLPPELRALATNCITRYGPENCSANCTFAAVNASIPNCALCHRGDGNGDDLDAPPEAPFVCDYCQAGFYRNGPSSCKLCETGFWCAGTKRNPCPLGFSTSETGRWDKSQCDVCDAGYGTQGSTCAACSTGTFSAGGTPLDCQYCPAGTLSIDLARTGRFGDRGTQCVGCPSPLVEDASGADCTCPAANRTCLCPAGWASVSRSGGPPCKACGGNTFANRRDADGATLCLPCPANSTATDGTGCECAPGFFSADGSAFVLGGCQPCPAGSVTALAGSSTCVACAPNFAPNPTRTECVLQTNIIKALHRPRHAAAAAGAAAATAAATAAGSE